MTCPVSSDSSTSSEVRATASDDSSEPAGSWPIPFERLGVAGAERVDDPTSLQRLDDQRARRVEGAVLGLAGEPFEAGGDLGEVRRGEVGHDAVLAMSRSAAGWRWLVTATRDRVSRSAVTA